MDNYTAIIPISYFGPIDYYKMLNMEGVYIEACENYQKRSIRNRASVLGANGPLTLSVPLVKGKTTVPITQVLISYDEDWHLYHLKTLASAYGSAPYYEHYIDEIEKILRLKYEHLFELTRQIYAWLEKIGYLRPVSYTTAYMRAVDKRQDCRQAGWQWADAGGAYCQVFEDRHGFVSGLSILDLLFNLGPEGKEWLY